MVALRGCYRTWDRPETCPQPLVGSTQAIPIPPCLNYRFDIVPNMDRLYTSLHNIDANSNNHQDKSSASGVIVRALWRWCLERAPLLLLKRSCGHDRDDGLSFGQLQRADTQRSTRDGKRR